MLRVLLACFVYYIGIGSCCWSIVVVACSGGLAGPVAVYGTTRAVGPALVVCGRARARVVCSVRLAAISPSGPYIPTIDDYSSTRRSRAALEGV